MNFRFKLLVAPLFAALCLLAAAIAQALGRALPPLFFVAAALIALGLAIVAVERWLRRPLLHLATCVLRQAESHSQPASTPAFAGVLGVLQRAVDRLVAVQRENVAELAYEKVLRRQAETALREVETRHAMALRAGGDGLWEWDLKTDAVHYSSAWKAALGHGDADIGDGLREWHDRIHPQDRAMVLAALDAHVAGNSELFECEYRLRHCDGSYRWFLARGRAIHAASGRPYKVIGLNSDIGTRKRAEEILYGIAEGMTTARGDAFFQQIVKSFAETLRVKYAFITQCVEQPPSRVRMLAAWMNGQYDEMLEYDLHDTPCDITIRQNTVNLIPAGLEALYPIEVGYVSYFGIPICNSCGDVIGHLACLDVKPMDEGLPTLPIFTLFAARAGVEMEARLLRSTQSSG